jgi:hypothetical protein
MEGLVGPTVIRSIDALQAQRPALTAQSRHFFALFRGQRPGRPATLSTSAWRTQLRAAVSVRSRSAPTDLPLSQARRAVRALNSLVNTRRLRLATEHFYRTVCDPS